MPFVPTSSVAIVAAFVTRSVPATTTYVQATSAAPISTVCPVCSISSRPPARAVKTPSFAVPSRRTDTTASDEFVTRLLPIPSRTPFTAFVQPRMSRASGHVFASFTTSKTMSPVPFPTGSRLSHVT